MTEPLEAGTVELDWFEPDASLVGRATLWVERVRHRDARYCHGGIRTPSGYYEVVETGMRKLSAVPRQPSATRLFQVASPENMLRGMAFLDSQLERGHRYSWLTIGADLLNALTGSHLICTVAGEHVCSSEMAWALIYFGLRDSDAPDAETPDSLAHQYGV